MPRKPKPDSTRQPYTVRVAPEQLARWEAAAAKARRPLSELVRDYVDLGFDRASRGEGRLSDLGREVLQLAVDYQREAES